MNDEQKRVPFRRIVVAFDTSPQGRALLELASDLARCFEVSLSGLFIEQEGMIDYAALPIAEEVILTSAALRPVTPERMEAHCHAQVRIARRYLDAVAARHRTEYSFLAHKGRTEAALSKFSRQADLILISPNVGFLAQPAPRDLLEFVAGKMSSGLIALTKPGQTLRAGPVIALLDRELLQAETILAATHAIARLPGIEEPLVIQAYSEEDETMTLSLRQQTKSAGITSCRFAKNHEELLNLLLTLQPALLVLSEGLAENTRESLIREGHSLLVVHPEH